MIARRHDDQWVRGKCVAIHLHFICRRLTHDIQIILICLHAVDDAVAVGDVVTVTGTVANDRDFGAGYTYTVMLEDAVVSP